MQGYIARTPHICELPESPALFSVLRRTLCSNNFWTRANCLALSCSLPTLPKKVFTSVIIASIHKVRVPPRRLRLCFGVHPNRLLGILPSGILTIWPYYLNYQAYLLILLLVLLILIELTQALSQCKLSVNASPQLTRALS